MVAPKVAIVLLNWNGRGYLQQFLPSVLASTYNNKEVIVVDNASTDDSVSFLHQNYPQVRIINLPENRGYAGGYNDALKQVQSDYYVLLNSDVEVHVNWIEPIISLMESDQSIGACQPKILTYSKRDTFEYAGAAGGWIDYLGYPFARGRIFDVCEKDEHQYDNTESVFWASGAAMFIKSNLFHELGGFDNYFFAHQEEIDFCWRLQLGGYKVYACPQSVVYHVGGGTLPKGNERKVFLNFRNNLIMLAKNTPMTEALWKLPLRIFLDAVSAWKSLFSGQGIYFTAVIEAHLAFAKWVLFKRSKSIFPLNRSGKLRGCYSKSIVWKHFAEGKKTFAEIVLNKR
jgi:GT2 family glycosyltransferase